MYTYLTHTKIWFLNYKMEIEIFFLDEKYENQFSLLNFVVDFLFCSFNLLFATLNLLKWSKIKWEKF